MDIRNIKTIQDAQRVFDAMEKRLSASEKKVADLEKKVAEHDGDAVAIATLKKEILILKGRMGGGGAI